MIEIWFNKLAENECSYLYFHDTLNHKYKWIDGKWNNYDNIISTNNFQSVEEFLKSSTSYVKLCEINE